MRRFCIFFVLFGLLMPQGKLVYGSSVCQGKFVDPFTINFDAILPIKFFGGRLTFGKHGVDTKNAPQVMCRCGVQPGIPTSFWDPVFVVEVTKTPFCFVSLGGLCMQPDTDLKSSLKKKRGVALGGVKDTEFSAQVHILKMPILAFLEIVLDFPLLEKRDFDIPYMSEFDPTWDRDKLALLISPTTFFFKNIKAQLSCMASSIRATFFNKATPSLYWCAGAWGSLLPLVGTDSSHVTIVGSSLLLAARALAKAQSIGKIKRTASDTEYLCSMDDAKVELKYFLSGQYKLQPVYPLVMKNSSRDPSVMGSKRESAIVIGKSPLRIESRMIPLKDNGDMAFWVFQKKSGCTKILSNVVKNIYHPSLKAAKKARKAVGFGKYIKKRVDTQRGR